MGMQKKKESRMRRARRARMHMRELGIERLCVYRSPRHIYAQIISPDGSVVRASASTVDKDLRGEKSGNKDSATRVGKLIAERAIQAGIQRVAFDRSGYKFHGRIKALADAAREAGLQF